MKEDLSKSKIIQNFVINRKRITFLEVLKGFYRTKTENISWFARNQKC